MGILIKTPATRLEKNVWVHLQERPQSVELDESVMEGWMDGWIAAASRLSTSEPQASKGSSVLSYMKSTVRHIIPGTQVPLACFPRPSNFWSLCWQPLRSPALQLS